MLLKQKSSESQLKSVPVLTLWTKKLDFVPKIIKKRLQDLFFVLTVPVLKTLLQQGVNRKR